MYPLVETIRIENGIPLNLHWHQQRYERSYKTHFGKSPQIILQEAVKVPAEYKKGVVKCRLLYGTDSFKTEFHNYSSRRILSLKLVDSNEIEYPHKFTERTSIKNLLKFKEDCDDILIVKKGFITDSSIANIVFFDGKDWTTPLNPLLKGTARERLVQQGRIAAEDIKVQDLKEFSYFRLINAMMDFDEQDMIATSAIK